MSRTVVKCKYSHQKCFVSIFRAWLISASHVDENSPFSSTLSRTSASSNIDIEQQMCKTYATFFPFDVEPHPLCQCGRPLSIPSHKSYKYSLNASCILFLHLMHVCIPSFPPSLSGQKRGERRGDGKSNA